MAFSWETLQIKKREREREHKFEFLKKDKIKFCFQKFPISIFSATTSNLNIKLKYLNERGS